MTKKLTLEEFIEKARAIHGDRYDYSEVIYKGYKHKIIIICPVHGKFKQKPITHLAGKGCQCCGRLNTIISRKLTQQEFIDRANKIHNNKYDYFKSLFKDIYTKIVITCPLHGDFEQIPNDHLSGKGCKICGNISIGKKLISNLNEFITKSNKIHNNLYSYKNFIYKNAVTKGYVTCKEHGDYLVSPNNHLRGRGCPTCKSSKGELVIKEILDKHCIKYIQEYRIPEEKYLLYYDFYLPDLNLLIEFHGEQHYRFVPHFHRTIEKFLDQRKRDAFKIWLAKEKHISLIELNYNHLSIPIDKFSVSLIKLIYKLAKIEDSIE